MKLLYGGYGHNPHGKQYVYIGGDNYRTGQNVVAPVTNPRTGKTYRTMFTIRRTSAGEMGENEIKRLENKGINVKSIEGRDVLSLPGGNKYSSAEQWKRDSNEQYDNRIRNRLINMNPNSVYRQSEGWNDTRRVNLKSVFLRRFG